MCISTLKKRLLDQQAEVEAKLAKVDAVENSVESAVKAVEELLQNCASALPDELPEVWQGILAIGQKFDLEARAIVADEERDVLRSKLCQRESERDALTSELQELRSELEAVQAENVKQENFLEVTEEAAANQIKDLQAEMKRWEQHSQKIEFERDDLVDQLQEARSQLAQMQATYINPNSSPHLTPEESTEVAKQLTNFAEELQRQRQGASWPAVIYLNPTPEAEEEARVTGFLQIGDTFSSAPPEIPKIILALTLWQPWASLTATGAKKIETRSWGTDYRGWLAIHAAQRAVDWSTLDENEYGLPEGKDWPKGAVVAICKLVDCVEMTPEFIAAQSQEERALGIWQPGRFAWVLESVRPINPPVPAKGAQKLWQWDTRASAVLNTGNEDVKVYEDEKACDTIESILRSHGFFNPDIPLRHQYSEDRKYEDYRGWEIYRDCHDRGVTGIGIYHEQFGFWDASTEMIDDIDPTFPEDFSNGNAIVTWTRGVIDQLVAITPAEHSEMSGQLALSLDFPDSALTKKELTELQKLLEGTNNYFFKKLGAKVKIVSYEFIENKDEKNPEVIEQALFTISDLDGEKAEDYCHSAEDLTRRKPIAGWNPLGNLMNVAESYAKKWAKKQSSKKLASRLEFLDSTDEQEEKLTELQKLLLDNSNFTFEELGVSVAIQSVMAPADDTVDFESEECQITVTDSAGNTREYFEDALTFVSSRNKVEQAALGYTNFLLQELRKEAEITEKITRWNAEKEATSGEVLEEPPIAETTDLEPTELETENSLDFEIKDCRVQVHPQYTGGILAGAGFQVWDSVTQHFRLHTVLLAVEMGDRPYKEIAQELIEAHEAREAAKRDRIANPYKKPEDDFIELVRLNPSVGYLKQKVGADAGKILATYVAFANKNAAGQRTATNSKRRAQSWRDFYHASFESLGWKVGEVQKVDRMKGSEPGKPEPLYEIKIVGASMEQIQKLTEEDFSLMPNEKLPHPTVQPPFAASLPTHTVMVNSCWLASGSEREMQVRFEEELHLLGVACTSVSLLEGEKILEKFAINDFEFIKVKDFDPLNPEFEVTHLTTRQKFTVFKKVKVDEQTATWRNSVHPYDGNYLYREGAAADAVRRSLKAQAAD